MEDWYIASIEQIGGPVLNPRGRLEVVFHVTVKNPTEERTIAVGLSAQHGVSKEQLAKQARQLVVAKIKAGWEPENISF